MSSKDPISSFCNALESFCNHLQSSSNALKQSINRRPIPLDSASSTFVQCLNRRVSTATSDLEMLDSKSFGTVSFEELLGHCNELYKKNQTDIIQLEDRLKSYGYVPASDIDEEDEVYDTQPQISDDKLDSPSSFYGSLSVAKSSFKKFEEDALLDESLSLKQLGLSDACLATLASEDNVPSQGLEKVLSLEADNENLKSPEAPSPTLIVLKSEFECLPAYIKVLASWEDLLVAVDKINSSLSKKTSECNFFRQDDIPSFDLGPKARSYLLLLVRMNRMVVETIDGLLSYRIL
ncbi:uncharacterized protein LOC123890276 [Trifolium pratense]|uniref:uncharacterized protein LOC123890276 n=1 Tax=Trifolium pratense TaxID=57577 RepID=UPI001E69116F|nr:uncharacterized protein LOC123890276 [Trifolium pratense]